MTVFRFSAFAALLCTMLVFSLHASWYEWANDNLWFTLPSALLALIAVERMFPGVERGPMMPHNHKRMNQTG